MTDNTLVLTGNLTADPELRYTQAGIPVCSFTVAHTPRTFDRANNEWKDGEALFMRCSAWRDLGENVAGSLVKGNRVTVIGSLKSNTYTTREGESRSSTELDCAEVAASLRFAQVHVAGRSQTPRGQQTAQARQQSTDAWSTPMADDTPF